MCPGLQIIDYQQADLIDLYIENASVLNLCGAVCIVVIVYGILNCIYCCIFVVCRTEIWQACQVCRHLG
mgnify:FL=1